MKFEIPEISAERRKAIEQALAAFDEVSRLNAAIDKQGERIVAAKAAHEAAAKALAENDTELALATTDAASRRIEAEGKKLSAALTEAVSDVDRQVRVGAALSGRLETAEGTLDGERIALQKVVQEHGGAVNRAFADHVAQAAVPLIGAMRMLVVAANATGAYVDQQLAEMLLPDLRGSGSMLHGLTMTALIDGKNVKLSAIGDDPVLAEVAQRVREPRMVLNQLEAYKSRAARTQEQVRDALFAQRGHASRQRD